MPVGEVPPVLFLLGGRLPPQLTLRTASGCKLARSMFSFKAYLALLFELWPERLQVCQMRLSLVALHCLLQATTAGYHDDGDLYAADVSTRKVSVTLRARFRNLDNQRPEKTDTQLSA